MKYGKLIQKATCLTNPSWEDKWMDYKKLKKIIKLIVRSNSTGSQIPSLEALSSSDEEDESKTIASPVVAGSSTQSNDAVDEVETVSGESMKQGLSSDILASMSSSEPEKMPDELTQAASQEGN